MSLTSLLKQGKKLKKRLGAYATERYENLKLARLANEQEFDELYPKFKSKIPEGDKLVEQINEIQQKGFQNNEWIGLNDDDTKKARALRLELKRLLESVGLY
jgi:hypothetical protein